MVMCSWCAGCAGRVAHGLSVVQHGAVWLSCVWLAWLGVRRMALARRCVGRMACGCAQHVRGMATWVATWGLDVALRCMVGLGLRRSAKGNLGIDISVAVP